MKTEFAQVNLTALRNKEEEIYTETGILVDNKTKYPFVLIQMGGYDDAVAAILIEDGWHEINMSDFHTKITATV